MTGLRALNQAFPELFGTASAFDGISVSGRTDPLLLNDATARVGIALDTVQRRRFHDRYCDLLEVEILEPGPRKNLMTGVEELLREVHHQPELCVGLLTGNFARAARIKLEHFGLWTFFVRGVYGDDAFERDDLVPVAVGRARTAWARSIAVATGSFDLTTIHRKSAMVVFPDRSVREAFLAFLDEF